jgi:hypothetical protein
VYIVKYILKFIWHNKTLFVPLYCVKDYLNQTTIMNIKETFLNLTKRTYPHGTEQDLFHLLPQNIETDEFGNKYITIGESPSTMFTSHLDTATSQLNDVTHTFDGNLIKTDGKTILGADDKAGVTIMLNMIEKNITGLYYFFLGEEVGCVGSRKLSQKHKTEPIPHIKKVVSFDRRGVDSVITHQLGGRCCSNEFGNALAKELNKANETFKYIVDPTGIYTDSAQFTSIYSECTNISVGYNFEHTSSEFQDIKHLELLSDAVLKVDWEGLPASRSTNDNDYEDYYSYRSPSRSTKTYSVWDEEDYPTTSKKSNNSWTTDYKFVDTDFDLEPSTVTVNKYNNQLVKVDFSNERLEYELDLIEDFLHGLEVEYDNMTWDGNELELVYEHGHTTKTKRHEMSEYLSELDFWKEHINIKVN